MLRRVHALFFAAAAYALFPSSVFAAQPITVTSWNLEWLSSSPSSRVAESQRDKGDFETLSRYFQHTESDLLAFQEVNDLDAIRKVVGHDYHVLLSDRANARHQRLQFEDINQFTGFAIRKGIPFRDVADIQLNQGTSKLRFASYIVIGNAPHEVHVLNVHLKAGCSGGYKNNPSCQTLKREAQALARWIEQREKNQQSYLILGDFNHNLAYPNGWFIKEIGLAPNVVLLTANTPAKCKVRSKKQPDKTHAFRSLIDHILVSDGLSASQAEQTLFTQQDVLRYQLSDHCPVSVTLTLR